MLWHLDYDASDNNKLEALNKKGDKRLRTYFYLINSHQNKYRNILVNLNSQKWLKNFQYSKIIVGGHNIFSNYKTAGEFKKINKNKSLKKGDKEENNTLSFAQVKFKCEVRDAKECGVPDCEK